MQWHFAADSTLLPRQDFSWRRHRCRGPAQRRMFGRHRGSNPCHCGIHHSPATIAGQQGTDDGGTTDIDVAIGDCVTPGEP
ncbi:hypothetical protein GON09_001256 [Rhodococcus sp. B50]|nr:hypothetical protein [Rhodococcus sp. B50]